MGKYHERVRPIIDRLLKEGANPGDDYIFTSSACIEIDRVEVTIREALAMVRKGGSPYGIGGGHRSDQLANLPTCRRASWPFRLGQSPPVAFESFALPSGDRLRLNEYERRSPILPQFPERNPKQSISIAQTWSLFLMRENSQLMTKCDVFQGDVLVATEEQNQESNHQQE